MNKHFIEHPLFEEIPEEEQVSISDIAFECTAQQAAKVLLTTQTIQTDSTFSAKGLRHYFPTKGNKR
jgi:hypothetical protein